jgi:penicillin-binding protein 2
MEAKTGRVVAMASYPSYDPSVFVGGASPAEYAELVDEERGAPLVFRAIQGAYAPASTFKVVSTIGAVQSGDYPLRGRYPCPGVYGPTGQRNFDSAALGVIDLRQALVKSCDTIFYKFAYEAWQRDGGNDPSRAEGPDGAHGAGLRPRRAHRRRPAERAARHHRRPRVQAAAVGADPRQPLQGRRQPRAVAQRRRRNAEYCEDGNRFRGGDATNFSIGQGDTLVTPLQLATVYAAVANGGQVLEPHVARALCRPTGRSARSRRRCARPSRPTRSCSTTSARRWPA